MLYNLLACLLSLVCILLMSIFSYLLWIGSTWKRKGIPSYGNPLVGIFWNIFRLNKPIGTCLKDIYLKEKNTKFYGTFLAGQPILVIQDREILKQVFLKDYSNFASHGFYYDSEKDPLSAHLFNLAADDWRFMRAKLSPTFSSGKIKFMFGTIQDCISTFHKAIDQEIQSKNGLVDIRELLARLGTDIISSVAFGIETNSVNNVNSAFRKIGKVHSEPGILRFIGLLLRLNAKFMKLIWLHMTVPEVNKFLLDAFSSTVNYREKNNITRNDFMNLLIRLKNENNSEKGDGGRLITVGDIAAQSFVFFVAGFETTSTTTGFALLELAKHPEIQKTVHEECDRVMEACGGNVTYDVIQTMEFLDKLLHETMRLYPSIAFLPRAVTSTCKLPQTDVTLEKDTFIMIPVHGFHMDEDLFPDPLQFDPERFSKENKDQIPPYAYMPFGEGRRHCIGNRFALVQMKAVLLELMSRYNVELSDEINPNPEFHPYNVILKPLGSFNLKMTPRFRN